jgi:twinkle protein
MDVLRKYPIELAPMTSEFVRHMACPHCGSSDAASLYDDGHIFCFRCYTHTPGDGTDVIHTHQMRDVRLQGSAGRLQKRRISEKTCEFFKAYKDGEQLRFHYYNSSGTLVGAKIKTKDKDFRCEGEVNTLYGMQNFRHKTTSKTKKLVIVEGEMDALSVWESQPNWDVVSVPNGAPAAKKAIQKNYEWVNYYDKVVIFFDNDEAGQKAAIESAGVLPPGKAYIGFLEGYKDASDALQAHDEEAVRAVCNYDHALYKPDGIVDAKSLLDVITTPTPPSDHDYPFQGLQSKLHGIRYGELVTITAGSGIGKSSFCRDLCTHLLNKGERVGYLALEESNRRTALGLMSAAVGRSLHLGEHDRSELVDAFDKTINKWNLHLFDGFGSYDPDHIYERIEYMASGLETRVVFLDHLSILLSGLDGDERKMIDTTMTKLRSLVERTGISLFLVSHLRRTTSDVNHEEGARVTLGQLRGSASIAQLSDACIALERDQQSGSKSGSTTVRVLKNRYSGEVGVACQLSYDLSTCKFNETQAEPEFDPTTDF